MDNVSPECVQEWRWRTKGLEEVVVWVRELCKFHVVSARVLC